MATYIPVLMLICVFYMAQAAKPLGYLFLNTSAPSACVKPGKSSQCDLSYDIFQFNDKVGKELQARMFAVPELAQKTLDFYPDTSAACRKAVEYYSCNNTFAVCKPDGKGGVASVSYNWKKTLAACLETNKVCPAGSRPYITYNCMMINKNPMDYGKCKKIIPPKRNVCSKFGPKYTYPLPSVRSYRTVVKLFGQAYNFFYRNKLPSDECRNDFLKINCNLNTGAICSTDGKLRMYAITQQDCTAVVNKCFKSTILTKLKPVYLTICKLYPDQSAPRVPLPK